jgi:hypothetical protein
MSLICNISRPAEPVNYWNTFAGNIFLLLFSAGGLLAAFLYPIDRFPLGFCVFLRLTGLPCPTCGFCRAFCAFAHGNWEQGVSNCPLTLILFFLVILLFVYNAAVVIAGIFGLQIRRGTILQLSSRKTVVLAIVFFLLLMANWIYRLVLNLK